MVQDNLATAVWAPASQPEVVWQRLRDRPQFEAVMAKPPRSKSPHFAVHTLPLTPLTEPSSLFAQGSWWIGVLIPKRWARRAVTRNALRRQIYAVARDLSASGSCTPQAIVVRLRASFSRQDFPSASSDALRQAARRELQHVLSQVCRA